MKDHGKIRRYGVAAVTLVSMALLGAGCGGTDGSAGGGDNRQARGEDAALQWAKCMRENGADVPDPKVDAEGRLVITPEDAPPNPADEAYRRALDECAELMRKALPDPGAISKEEEARMRDAALEFTKCMRAQGIDMPDPSTRGGGVSVPVQPNDPAFRRAAEACQDKLPFPGGGS